ncbi:hypothetical protein CAC42_3093 [Sphaceloma murrayae]|uniref:Uncharacterized protein n=1 Tax=Sphaceloma murrayae TaxID=2082308 RepID=A0A2K1QRI5_9PEZI|nr:hypothetical protein CAC42_3093 [Sphaceloma murrayae]
MPGAACTSPAAEEMLEGSQDNPSLTQRFGDINLQLNNVSKTNRQAVQSAHEQSVLQLRAAIEGATPGFFTDDAEKAKHMARLQRLTHLLDKKATIESEILKHHSELHQAYVRTVKIWQGSMRDRTVALQAA